MGLDLFDCFYIGKYVEGFLFGLYSGIFALYTIQTKDTNNVKTTNHVIFYSLCVLYVLSLATVIADMTDFLVLVDSAALPLYFILTTLVACCDFISQFILIYRCWIVWGCNIHVVIIPSILAFTFLATSLAANGTSSAVPSSTAIEQPDWAGLMMGGSHAVSLTVNGLVTGLIIFKIFKVYQEVKSTLDDQASGPTSGRSKIRFRTVIFILIESGMVLFSIQLARIVVTIMLYIWPTHWPASYNALVLIAPIHQMLNGLTPTIILVRVSMGLSFYDKTSLESTVGSLRFTSDNPNLIPEMEDVDIMLQESRGTEVLIILERSQVIK